MRTDQQWRGPLSASFFRDSSRIRFPVELGVQVPERVGMPMPEKVQLRPDSIIPYGHLIWNRLPSRFASTTPLDHRLCIARSPASGRSRWSSPIPAARLNSATKWPEPGAAPAFQRNTVRALTFRQPGQAPAAQPGGLTEGIQPVGEVRRELLRFDVIDPLLASAHWTASLPDRPGLGGVPQQHGQLRPALRRLSPRWPAVRPR